MRGGLRVVILAGILALAGLAPPRPAQAQFADAAVAAFLAGAAGLAIVDRLDQKFQSLNAQALGTANLATGNALIAAESVLGGLRQAFAQERQATFEALGDERKAIIIQVYQLLDRIEKRVAVERGHLKADAVDLMNAVPLLVQKVHFMLTSIDPIVFAWREGGGYELQLIGVGVGLPNSTQNYRVRVEVDGVEMKPEALSPTPNMLKVRLPDELMKSRFAERDTINTLPVKVTSTHTHRCGVLWLGSCEEVYAIRFDVRLYPRVAGTVTAHQTRPRAFLAHHRTLTTNDIATGDHNNRPEGVYGSGPIVAPPGWRVTRAWYDPGRCRAGRPNDGNPCAFYSGPHCVIQGAVANCTVAQGSHPKIFQFTYEIAEEKTAPEELPAGAPLDFGLAQARPVEFDRHATYVRLDVKLADGRSGAYSLKPDAGWTGGAPPLLTCGQIAHLGQDASRADCWINLPN